MIKKESEKYWEQINLDLCWRFQIQEGSKWKKGLSEFQLEDFQKQLGIIFPESLKNYYHTMNGLGIIIWADNLLKGLAKDIFSIYSIPEEKK